MLTLTNKRRAARIAAAASAAAAAALLSPTSAQAAASKCVFPSGTPAGITCTTSYDSGSKVTTIRSGTGSVLRAAFYDSWIRYSGDRILYYGSGSCSASTDDTDFRLNELPDGWNDKVSSVQDFSACDVNLFQHTKFAGESTGYRNYGSGGGHLSFSWHRNVSSFKIS